MKGNRISLIAAYAKSNRGIGYKNDLVWRYKEDMDFFRQTTTLMREIGIPNKVVMGRKTWYVKFFFRIFVLTSYSLRTYFVLTPYLLHYDRDSIPPRFKPLPDRKNIVVSRTIKPGTYSYNHEDDNLVNVDCQYDHLIQGVHDVRNIEVVKSLDDALDIGGYTFVIGGSQLYEQAINDNRCDTLYLTEVDDTDKDYEFDTFFPKLPTRFRLDCSTLGHNDRLTFNTYKDWTDRESQEYQYLNLLQEILDKGERRQDRTGIGTIRLE